MFVFDPERRVNASVDLLMQDLGVTRREAELAALLAEGQDLQSIARRLSISEDTARKHLKSIYTKTDLHSQADLVRRILTSPAWIRSA
jgi:DNA-binding CsgD family transcriptional regulator